ncbi:MAG: hypothetical protein MJH10_19750, partial [Epibacterium sp.]|nr:hypothetical protein [Epibacterium sp.]NQX75717.1 hypothetical protein [Epibacterium sp.]
GSAIDDPNVKRYLISDIRSVRMVVEHRRGGDFHRELYLITVDDEVQMNSNLIWQHQKIVDALNAHGGINIQKEVVSLTKK